MAYMARPFEAVPSFFYSQHLKWRSFTFSYRIEICGDRNDCGGGMNEVYCHHCGREHAADAVYCSQCGKLLDSLVTTAEELDNQKSAALDEWEIGTSEASAALELEPSKLAVSRGRAILIGLIPIFIFVVTAAAVLSIYLYESNMNERVLEWQNKAKQEALDGNYEAALERLNKAAEARPEYESVRADLAVVKEAAAFQQTIDAVNEKLKQNEVQEAKPLLEELMTKLRGREEQVFAVVREQAADLTVRMTVIQVEDELGELKTVEELVVKLNQVKGLNGEDALELKKQIEAQIAEIIISQANDLLKKKNFTEALSIIQKGITYVPDDEKLAKLYDKVQKDKKKFEQAEQQRIENAMQKAAEEELINQTAAVEVLKTETDLDLFGDFHINGKLKNAATRPIYSVSIEYTVRDSEGNVIESGTVEATPAYVESGETFSFNAVVHDVEDEKATVVIDHATWYLD